MTRSNLRSRRQMLTGMVAGMGAATVAAAAIAGIPAIGSSPQERARRAWAEFSAAMREITADAHGWIIYGAGEREAFENVRSGAWLYVHSIHYQMEHEPRVRGGVLMVERHREITLDGWRP